MIKDNLPLIAFNCGSNSIADILPHSLTFSLTQSMDPVTCATDIENPL